MPPHRIFQTSFASVYPLTLAKLEKKGRTRVKLDSTFEHLLVRTPAINPARAVVTGTICGVRIAAIEAPLMPEIRYLDKLVDELAKGQAKGKVCNTA